MSVYIIAEAGVNHNGDLKLAKKLVDVAKNAGADAVKFQTFKTENLVTKSCKKAEYQIENLKDNDDSQFLMLKKLELTHDDHVELIQYCRDKKIEFISTPFDLESADLLFKLNVSPLKLSSGDVLNVPLLRKVGRFGREIILSTGLSNLDDIQFAITTLVNSGLEQSKITILHCNTDYPTPFCDVNLMAMQTIKNKFNLKVGYSDHTLGIEVPIAAVALGAQVIEKHITLDKKMPGPDHVASLNPDELSAMVVAIRNIELAIGDGIKKITPSEQKNINVARKSIVANSSIKKGDIFSDKNLTVKRPGTGISTKNWDMLIGKVSLNDYNEDDLISLGELK